MQTDGSESTAQVDAAVSEMLASFAADLGYSCAAELAEVPAVEVLEQCASEMRRQAEAVEDPSARAAGLVASFAYRAQARSRRDAEAAGGAKVLSFGALVRAWAVEGPSKASLNVAERAELAALVRAVNQVRRRSRRLGGLRPVDRTKN